MRPSSRIASDEVKSLRRIILQMVHSAKEGHIPSAFSIVDILYVLYRDCLKYDPANPKCAERDCFVLSKGHAGAALYATLAHFGFFSGEDLKHYCTQGSKFGGHPDALKAPGVEVSSGSLGHGIAMAVGMAMAMRLEKSSRKVVALVGDGEMDEGSFWESVMLARNLGLDNLIVIADCNGSQKYSYPYDYAKILKSYDWAASEVNGHDLDALSQLLTPLVREPTAGPQFVVAHTEKGHGVARFVGEHGWHRRTPTDNEMIELMRELA